MTWYEQGPCACCWLQYLDDGVTLITVKSQCVGNYTDSSGNTVPRMWQNSFYNFDNVGTAMLTVFHVSVLDNFMDDVAYQCMDSVGECSCSAECGS